MKPWARMFDRHLPYHALDAIAERDAQHAIDNLRADLVTSELTPDEQRAFIDKATPLLRAQSLRELRKGWEALQIEGGPVG